MVKLITIVLKRDGSLHMASDKVPPADAQRWAEEGYSVFMIASEGRRWAVNQLPTGKLFTDMDVQAQRPESELHHLLLTFNKEEKQ